MFGSFVALLAFSLVGTVEGMEDYLFQNQMKLVFCDQIKAQPVYRNEDLAENCVIKVDVFYGKVTLITLSKNLLDPSFISLIYKM